MRIKVKTAIYETLRLFILTILSRVGIGFSSAPSSHLEKDPKFFLISKVEKWPYPVHRAEVSSANK